jgi:hypothetical protein
MFCREPNFSIRQVIFLSPILGTFFKADAICSNFVFSGLIHGCKKGFFAILFSADTYVMDTFK